ncbi:MAG TPA: hypothetical protein VLF43_02535 [Candidatus Saccharimonadales bacterium]|nr:hypothetical protein [Candidatus Saccharimonadales bacterium]
MQQCYVELRKSAARGTDSIAADIMRHLYTRQHLGKAIIISDRPLDYLGPVRKQWLKLSRSLQKERATTLNADKILKYTHTITRMQHMHIAAKPPLEQPDADVYLLSPEDTAVMPLHCYTVYLLTPLDMARANHIVQQLPPSALVVDYNKAAIWEELLGLLPKKTLEEAVGTEWRQVEHYLQRYHIDIDTLHPDAGLAYDAMDDALDTLLGHSQAFLQIVGNFQRALELARPFKASKEQRSTHDTLILLPHRVQALSPGSFSRKFLESFNEDDAFFLYDAKRHLSGIPTESLAQAFVRHNAAGRRNLARALQAVYS